jgi:chromosome segregation ATPase
VDEETKTYFDRLMRETVDGRQALERRVERYHNETLTNLDGIFKELGELKVEYHALKAAVSRLEEDFRQERLSRQEVRLDIVDLRNRMREIEERLTLLEASTRNNHDA